MAKYAAKPSAQLTATGAHNAISSPASSEALFADVDADDNTETRRLWHNDWELTAHRDVCSLALNIVKSNFDLADVVNTNILFRYYGSTLGASVVQSASSRDIVGLYGQYQHQLFKDTQLTLGLRHDCFSSIGSNLVK